MIAPADELAQARADLAAMTARAEAAEERAGRLERSEASALEMLRTSVDARAALDRYRYEVERALRSAIAIGTWDDDVGAVGYIKRLREGYGTQADAWLAWGRDVLARHDARRPGEPARLSVPCGEAVRDEIGHIVSEVIYQARIAFHEKNCRCYAQARSTRARRALARWKGVAVRAKREHAAMARGLQGAYELNALAEGARYRAENAARRWKALARATRKRAASSWWLIGESLGAAALADYGEHWAREEAERRGRHLVEARRELAAARRDYDRWAARKNAELRRRKRAWRGPLVDALRHVGGLLRAARADAENARNGWAVERRELARAYALLEAPPPRLDGDAPWHGLHAEVAELGRQFWWALGCCSFDPTDAESTAKYRAIADEARERLVALGYWVDGRRLSPEQAAAWRAGFAAGPGPQEGG